MNTNVIPRATIYFQNEFGFAVQSCEVRDLELEVRPYAQYTAAVQATFVPKGKRNRCRIVQGYKPTLVVVEGWGHETPPGSFRQVRADVVETKHTSFSGEWLDGFDAWFAAQSFRVLADFRAHDSNDRFASVV